jgi:hypothetical protein
MEAQNIVVIAGVATLLLDRLFACLRRVRKSKCCGSEIELSKEKSLNESDDKNDTSNHVEK